MASLGAKILAVVIAAIIFIVLLVLVIILLVTPDPDEPGMYNILNNILKLKNVIVLEDGQANLAMTKKVVTISRKSTIFLLSPRNHRKSWKFY